MELEAGMNRKQQDKTRLLLDQKICESLKTF